jgi:hypothetical protein
MKNKKLVILLCGMTRASVGPLTPELIKKYQISFLENEKEYVLKEPGVTIGSNAEVGKIGEYLSSFKIHDSPEVNKIIGIYDPENIEHLKEMVKISGEIFFERCRDEKLNPPPKVLIKFIDQQKALTRNGARIQISENGSLIAEIDARITNDGAEVIFQKDKKNFKNTKTITTAFRSAEYGELHGVD